LRSSRASRPDRERLKYKSVLNVADRADKTRGVVYKGRYVVVAEAVGRVLINILYAVAAPHLMRNRRGNEYKSATCDFRLLAGYVAPKTPSRTYLHRRRVRRAKSSPLRRLSHDLRSGFVLLLNFIAATATLSVLRTLLRGKWPSSLRSECSVDGALGVVHRSVVAAGRAAFNRAVAQLHGPFP